MNTLTQQNLHPEPTVFNGPVGRPESWGLLLIPVLLCVSMFMFGLFTEAAPAPAEVPASHSCASLDASTC